MYKDEGALSRRTCRVMRMSGAGNAEPRAVKEPVKRRAGTPQPRGRFQKS